MPPPVPPRVNEGLITAGKPIHACTSSACSRLWAMPELADASPIRVIAALNFSRSSALSIAFLEAPISSTSNLVSTPSRARSRAQLSAVCPPIIELERPDVRHVGHLRVGHDRGRIGIDQDDLVAFLAQCLARLGARIVELAGLADDDRACADDEDAFDVGALRHLVNLAPQSSQRTPRKQSILEIFSVLSVVSVVQGFGPGPACARSSIFTNRSNSGPRS